VKQRKTSKLASFFSPLQEVKFHYKREACNVCAQAKGKFRGCDGGSTSGQQVVDD